MCVCVFTAIIALRNCHLSLSFFYPLFYAFTIFK